MTVSQPAIVTYFVITPQCGQRNVATERVNFFSSPVGPDYAKVVGIVSGNPAFAQIKKEDGSTQLFATKGVVYACCTAKTPTDVPEGDSACVEILFDNCDLTTAITLRDTQQNVSDMVRRELNTQPILILSNGFSETIVAKVSRIADVTVSPNKQN